MSRHTDAMCDDDDHPTRRGPGVFPVDDWLRDAGFRIHGRPRNDEPTWAKGKDVFQQYEAIALARPAPTTDKSTKSA